MSDKKILQSLPPPAVTLERRPRPMTQPPVAERLYPEIEYPSEDGQPMADDSWQARAMTALYSMLSDRYKDDPRIFVGIDLLVYYTEGEPNHSLAPDVFVAFGVEDRDRYWYKIWEEGKVPDFVVEIASKSTAESNLGAKKDAYERLGVREYCVYDPRGGLHWPRLQLFRLVRRRYESVRGRGDPDASLALPSEVLGLELRFEEDRLKLWDPAACEYLLEYSEEKARRRAAEEREARLREREARLAAEATLRKLQARLAEFEIQSRKPR